jgi:hypothetical protein
MPDRNDRFAPDDTDHMLDSALSTYAAPKPGLEDRILRSLATARTTPSGRHPLFTRRWLPWAIAVPIAAALALFFLPTHRTPAPPGNYAQTTPQSHLPSTPSRPPESSTARPTARAVHHPPGHGSPASEVAIRRALPKQNIFPSPQPLSSEEQALAAIAAHGPEQVRQSLIDAQVTDAPITISAIQIQPLTMPDAGQN